MIEKLRIFCIEETEWVGICTGRQPERNARRERAALAKHGRHRAFLGPIIVPFRRHYRKLFKNPCSQAELNKIVPFGFSLQRQKMVFFCHQNSIILLC